MHPSSFAAKPVCYVRSRQRWIAQAKVTKLSIKLTAGEKKHFGNLVSEKHPKPTCQAECGR